MYVLFDIGGTKTRISFSDDLTTFDSTVKFDTDHDFESGIQHFISELNHARRGREITGIAGGIRGILNREKTMMVRDPGHALDSWAGRPLAPLLAETFGVPVKLANDAAIVGLGEAAFGAGVGYSIVAYHTVSTGVGGARIIDGVIDESASGFEPGHQLLDVDRSIFGSTYVHSLENLVSGTALQARRGIKPYEIPQSDPVWDELARYLAHGLKNTIAYWSPDVIVLGGSMIVGNPRIMLDDIVRHTKAVCGDELIVPPILDARLKDEGGLYGAMALLKSK